MDNNLMDFVKYLSKKKCKNSRYYEDVAQDVLIRLYEEKIEVLEGNELKINGYIQYELNKNKKIDKKEIQSSIHKMNIVDNPEYEFNAENIIPIYDNFIDSVGLDLNDAELFKEIKIYKNNYKELNLDSSKYRKKISRIYHKFKGYLKENNIKINNFYE